MTTLAVRWRDGGFEAKCPLCEEFLELTPEFWHRGRLTRCRACWVDYQANWQAGYTADECVRRIVRMKGRLRYMADRDRRLVHNRAYKAANRDRYIAYGVAWRARKAGDPGPMEAYRREWPDQRFRAAPPEAIRRRRQWRESKRRARMQQATA
ncbi:MAG TPA: hypothetical protein VII01_04005 [Solirubrobacteraceae bacterium]